MTKTTTFKFKSLTTARNFVNRAIVTLMIVLGDDGYHWVVSPAVASKLEKQGYEVL